MKYRIVIAEDNWLECYYRRWFKWHCIGCYYTIEDARQGCQKHIEGLRKQQIYEEFRL